MRGFDHLASRTVTLRAVAVAAGPAVLLVMALLRKNPRAKDYSADPPAQGVKPSARGALRPPTLFVSVSSLHMVCSSPVGSTSGGAMAAHLGGGRSPQWAAIA